MNGIALLLAACLATQLTQEASQVPEMTGWQINAEDGELEFLIHIHPNLVDKLIDKPGQPAQEIENRIPPALHGRVSRIIVRVSDVPPDRYPSEAEIIKKYPPLLSNVPSLSNLNNRGTGRMTTIDPHDDRDSPIIAASGSRTDGLAQLGSQIGNPGPLDRDRERDANRGGLQGNGLSGNAGSGLSSNGLPPIGNGANLPGTNPNLNGQGAIGQNGLGQGAFGGPSSRTAAVPGAGFTGGSNTAPLNPGFSGAGNGNFSSSAGPPAFGSSLTGSDLYGSNSTPPSLGTPSPTFGAQQQFGTQQQFASSTYNPLSQYQAGLLPQQYAQAPPIQYDPLLARLAAANGLGAAGTGIGTQGTLGNQGIGRPGTNRPNGNNLQSSLGRDGTSFDPTYKTEPQTSVMSILFLISFVFNFYIGIYLYKLRERYRSLLSSVRTGSEM